MITVVSSLIPQFPLLSTFFVRIKVFLFHCQCSLHCLYQVCVKHICLPSIYSLTPPSPPNSVSVALATPLHWEGGNLGTNIKNNNVGQEI